MQVVRGLNEIVLQHLAGHLQRAIHVYRADRQIAFYRTPPFLSDQVIEAHEPVHLFYTPAHDNPAAGHFDALLRSRNKNEASDDSEQYPLGIGETARLCREARQEIVSPTNDEPGAVETELGGSSRACAVNAELYVDIIGNDASQTVSQVSQPHMTLRVPQPRSVSQVSPITASTARRSRRQCRRVSQSPQVPRAPQPQTASQVPQPHMTLRVPPEADIRATSTFPTSSDRPAITPGSRENDHSVTKPTDQERARMLLRELYDRRRCFFQNTPCQVTMADAMVSVVEGPIAGATFTAAYRAQLQVVHVLLKRWGFEVGTAEYLNIGSARAALEGIHYEQLSDAGRSLAADYARQKGGSVTAQEWFKGAVREVQDALNRTQEDRLTRNAIEHPNDNDPRKRVLQQDGFAESRLARATDTLRTLLQHVRILYEVTNRTPVPRPLTYAMFAERQARPPPPPPPQPQPQQALATPVGGKRPAALPEPTGKATSMRSLVAAQVSACSF